VGVADISGASIATPLLFRIFNTIDYDSNEEWFSQPKDCDIRQVCSETGLVPSEHCTSRITDYFIPLISSTQVCSNYQEVMVSPDEKIAYKVVEPDMQAWYTENMVGYERIPTHNPDCELIFKGNAPFITSPTNGAEYYIDKKDPEPLKLVCKTANDVSKVYWYINDKLFKTSNAGEAQFFVPEEGPVKISCTDDKGRNRDIKIEVKLVNL
jgi:penicillin-binding protein 1C